MTNIRTKTRRSRPRAKAVLARRSGRTRSDANSRTEKTRLENERRKRVGLWKTIRTCLAWTAFWWNWRMPKKRQTRLSMLFRTLSIDQRGTETQAEWYAETASVAARMLVWSIPGSQRRLLCTNCSITINNLIVPWHFHTRETTLLVVSDLFSQLPILFCVIKYLIGRYLAGVRD